MTADNTTTKLERALQAERTARREAEAKARQYLRDADELRGRCVRVSDMLNRANTKIVHLERELGNRTTTEENAR